MKNIIIFDASSPVVFLGYSNTPEILFKSEKFEKKELNTKLPELLESFSDKLTEILPARVIIGSGPGSFTGIKTGLAMFLSMLYAHGVEKIEKVSSGMFLRMLQPSIQDYSITAIPFNKKQYFISFFDDKGSVIASDTFVDHPYDQLDETVKLLKGKKVSVITPCLLEDSFKDYLLSKNIDFKVIDKDFSLKPDSFKKVEVFEPVNFCFEPLLLNYINLPANISKDIDIYTNNNLEEKNEN